MKNNKLKSIVAFVVVLPLLALANLALASEVTGNLSTGISSTLGNTVNGTVIVTPTPSPVAGTYTSAQSVTLTASGASSIHYSTDGSTPTCTSGTTYSGAISIVSTKTIKALSCYSGDNKSAVASFAYTITSVDGSTQNVSLTSSTSGQADLPTGATSIVLTNTTVLDLSSSKTAQTSTNVTVGGNVVALTQSVILQSGVDNQPVVLTNSNLSNISVSIPDGTKIQGPAGWDGKITPPVTGTSSGTAPAGFSVGNTVISVGSSDGTLVFDSPVTILLAGVTGTVGYRPSGSNTWVQITNTCGGTYTTPTAPTYPGECAISNGTDTKIVTYHFTTFGSLTVNSSGGGGGGGGGSYVPPVVTPTPVVTVVTPTVIAGCDNRTTGFSVTTGHSCIGNTGTTPTVGQVLGAEKFNFTLLLKNNSKGNEVMELQKFLTALGYNLGTADGKFGAKTKAAVIKFQVANKLKGDGIVGPKVRALLNK